MLVGLWDGGAGSDLAEILIDGSEEGYFIETFIGITVLLVRVVIVSTGEANFANTGDCGYSHYNIK